MSIKTKKHVWEMIDESGADFLENFIPNQDIGPIAERGMNYRRPVENIYQEILKYRDHQQFGEQKFKVVC